MSIISVDRVTQSGSWEAEKYQREYDDKFQVFASRSDDVAAVIAGTLSSLSLTLRTSVWATDPLATLQNVSASISDHGADYNKWSVDLKYKTKEPLEYEENPLDEETQFSCTFEKFNRPLLKDLSDTPKDILNSAWEPFDSVPEQESHRIKITLSGNYDWSTFDAADWPSPLADTVNSVEWCGYPAYSCLCAGISIKREKRNGVIFANVSFEILVDLVVPFFPTRVLNCGYRELIMGLTPDWTNINDSHGQPISKPAMLDLEGRKLTPGDPPTYGEFKFYNLNNWDLMPSIPG